MNKRKLVIMGENPFGLSEEELNDILDEFFDMFAETAVKSGSVKEWAEKTLNYFDSLDGEKRVAAFTFLMKLIDDLLSFVAPLEGYGINLEQHCKSIGLFMAAQFFGCSKQVAKKEAEKNRPEDGYF